VRPERDPGVPGDHMVVALACWKAALLYAARHQQCNRMYGACRCRACSGLEATCCASGKRGRSADVEPSCGVRGGGGGGGGGGGVNESSSSCTPCAASHEVSQLQVAVPWSLLAAAAALQVAAWQLPAVLMEAAGEMPAAAAAAWGEGCGLVEGWQL
jgi:hypothetical protein